MSVTQISTATSHTISAAKNDTSIEVPFDKACANLNKLANLSIGQWIGAANNELVIWNYLTTWFYSPDNAVVELVKNSVQSVLNAIEKDKVKQATAFCDHKKVAQGFKIVVMTYKAYPDLSQKLGEIAAFWDSNKPSDSNVAKANKLLIIRTLKCVPSGPASRSVLEKSELFENQRRSNLLSTVPEGNYPKDVYDKHNPSNRMRTASAALPRTVETVRSLRAGSSVLNHADFSSELQVRRTEIFEKAEQQRKKLAI
jgi:hypothetical protein